MNPPIRIAVDRTPFISIPANAIGGLSPTELSVYVWLWSFCHRDKRFCWPSIPRLQILCGIKRAETIQKALKTLVARSLLEIKPQYRDDGSRTSNLYTLFIIEAKVPEIGVENEDVDTESDPPHPTFEGGGARTVKPGRVGRLNRVVTGSIELEQVKHSTDADSWGSDVLVKAPVKKTGLIPGIEVESLPRNFKKWTYVDFVRSVQEANQHPDLKLPEKEIQKFIRKFGEHSTPEVMLFQQGKSWETNLRLFTWKENMPIFNRSFSGSGYKPQTPRNFLADDGSPNTPAAKAKARSISAEDFVKGTL